MLNTKETSQSPSGPTSRLENERSSNIALGLSDAYCMAIGAGKTSMRHPVRRQSITILFVFLSVLPSTNLVGLGRIISAPQESERTLDIERFASEPLELVEMKVRDQSIKDKIKTKSRSNGKGLVRVTFTAEQGWLRHL